MSVCKPLIRLVRAKIPRECGVRSHVWHSVHPKIPRECGVQSHVWHSVHAKIPRECGVQSRVCRSIQAKIPGECGGIPCLPIYPSKGPRGMRGNPVSADLSRQRSPGNAGESRVCRSIQAKIPGECGGIPCLPVYPGKDPRGMRGNPVSAGLSKQRSPGKMGFSPMSAALSRQTPAPFLSHPPLGRQRG